MKYYLNQFNCKVFLSLIFFASYTYAGTTFELEIEERGRSMGKQSSCSSFGYDGTEYEAKDNARDKVIEKCNALEGQLISLEITDVTPRLHKNCGGHTKKTLSYSAIANGICKAKTNTTVNDKEFYTQIRKGFSSQGRDDKMEAFKADLWLSDLSDEVKKLYIKMREVKNAEDSLSLTKNLAKSEEDLKFFLQIHQGGSTYGNNNINDSIIVLEKLTNEEDREFYIKIRQKGSKFGNDTFADAMTVIEKLTTKEDRDFYLQLRRGSSKFSNDTFADAMTVIEKLTTKEDRGFYLQLRQEGAESTKDTFKNSMKIISSVKEKKLKKECYLDTRKKESFEKASNTCLPMKTRIKL